MKNETTTLHVLKELRERVVGRTEWIKESDRMIPDEIKYRQAENDLFVKIIDVEISHLNPLDSIETVRGLKFKIGDVFHIKGNDKVKYTVVFFPDKFTIRGRAENPPIGEPWIVEAYVEDCFKPEKEKPIEPEPKRKKVDIEVGDYFAIRTNNTVYKATKVKKKKVFGVNKLTSTNAPKSIGALRTDIILKTKKDYKQQHKAEETYKEKVIVTPQKARRLR